MKTTKTAISSNTRQSYTPDNKGKLPPVIRVDDRSGLEMKFDKRMRMFYFGKSLDELPQTTTPPNIIYEDENKVVINLEPPEKDQNDLLKKIRALPESAQEKNSVVPSSIFSSSTKSNYEKIDLDNSINEEFEPFPSIETIKSTKGNPHRSQKFIEIKYTPSEGHEFKFFSDNDRCVYKLVPINFKESNETDNLNTNPPNN
ncbi:TPA: hypothetical protein ACGWTM_002940 [Legionella pneumophila]